LLYQKKKCLESGTVSNEWNWKDLTHTKQLEYYDCPNLNEITVYLFDLLEKEQVEMFKYKHFKN